MGWGCSSNPTELTEPSPRGGCIRAGGRGGKSEREGCTTRSVRGVLKAGGRGGLGAGLGLGKRGGVQGRSRAGDGTGGACGGRVRSASVSAAARVGWLALHGCTGKAEGWGWGKRAAYLQPGTPRVSQQALPCSNLNLSPHLTAPRTSPHRTASATSAASATCATSATSATSAASAAAAACPPPPPSRHRRDGGGRQIVRVSERHTVLC